MAFVKIYPSKNRPSTTRAKQVVRAIFAKIKRKTVKEGYNLIVYIGKEVADKIGAVAGDKIAISYDEQNNRRLLLEKSNTGYTLTKISGKEAAVYKVMLQWGIFTPKEEDFSLKELKIEFTDKGVIVLL